MILQYSNTVALTTPSTDPGFVYVLESGERFYKIGRAQKPDVRIKQLKIQLPFPVSLAYCFFSPDHKAAEKSLHEKFAAKRLNGEWFALDLDDLAFIHGYAECRGFYETRDGRMSLDAFYPIAGFAGHQAATAEMADVDLNDFWSIVEWAGADLSDAEYDEQIECDRMLTAREQQWEEKLERQDEEARQRAIVEGWADEGDHVYPSDVENHVWWQSLGVEV